MPPREKISLSITEKDLDVYKFIKSSELTDSKIVILAVREYMTNQPPTNPVQPRARASPDMRPTSMSVPYTETQSGKQSQKPGTSSKSYEDYEDGFISKTGRHVSAFGINKGR